MPDESAILFADDAFRIALRERAQAVRFIADAERLQVQLFVDGYLSTCATAPARLGRHVADHLWSRAGLTATERLGFSEHCFDYTLDNRVSKIRMTSTTDPRGVMNVSLSFLDEPFRRLRLPELGLSAPALDTWQSLLAQARGLVIVTGATGQGKTTALYASLEAIDSDARSIATVEHEIERRLPGVTQTSAGFQLCDQRDELGRPSFPAALRDVLASGPDVLMVDPIRDPETARLAVRAALDGRLVLASLSSGFGPGVLTRLFDMGIEPGDLAAISGVLTTHRARKLCDRCKQQAPPPAPIAAILSAQGLPAERYWIGKGCDRCWQSGYRGATGIYELLAVNDPIRELIAFRCDWPTLQRCCREHGMAPFRTAGLQRAIEGVVSAEEVVFLSQFA